MFDKGGLHIDEKIVALSISQWLPCPLAIWNLLFGVAILLNNSMKTKLDHTDSGEILGTSTINHQCQWLGFKEYIKKIEDEFLLHRLVSNINRHNGKVPLNKESVRKIKKKHYGNVIWRQKKENTILNIVGLEIKSVN